MEDIITVEQGNTIADQFVKCASQLSDKLFTNWDILSDQERSNMQLKVHVLRREATSMTALIIGEKLQNLKDTLKEITQATDRVQQAITTIDNMKEVIEFATAAIRLAAAIVTLNPTAIGAAMSAIPPVN